MSQYLLINRIQVQGANAVAGFTWGFPAITHFLGYSHNLSRKLNRYEENEVSPYQDIKLSGCAVIAHQYQVHTYGFNQLVQSKNPAYQYKEAAKNKVGSPPIIEEGKMNMTVSLLMKCEGNIGNRKEALIDWLKKTCQRQRLAGGTVLDIAEINFFNVDVGHSSKNVRTLVRKLLPGFVLRDRSSYLANHFQSLQDQDTQTELFDAWLDFIALKQKARPACDQIHKHLVKRAESIPEDQQEHQLLQLWLNHLGEAYGQGEMPGKLVEYFAAIPEDQATKKLIAQWQAYLSPNEKTQAVWEYVEKPKSGFLVPIMVGYKAISQLYKNHEVANTRDNKTDVCFVEAVHSIGEWQGIHRIRDGQALSETLWHYQYEKHWYLCKQGATAIKPEEAQTLDQNPDDDFS